VPRKSTGKRLRFEIFKRDGFTCQYCGAQPPTVVLVVDHITPVASEGPSTPENLITACEACNQGKADKPLGERMVRPDADLMYLETQQEIAELQRYQESAAKRDALIQSIMVSLQDIWAEVSGLDWHPGDHIIHGLMTRYPPFIVERAIRDVAPKVANGYVKSYGGKWVPYLYKVAQTMHAEDIYE